MYVFELRWTVYLFVPVDISCVFPLVGVQAVGDHEVGDPFLDVAPALSHNPTDGGGHAQVDQQPLVLGRRSRTPRLATGFVNPCMFHRALRIVRPAPGRARCQLPVLNVLAGHAQRPRTVCRRCDYKLSISKLKSVQVSTYDFQKRKIFKNCQDFQKFVKIFKNCQDFQKLSRFSKIVKIFKNFKNCQDFQKFQKLSRFSKIVKIFYL